MNSGIAGVYTYSSRSALDNAIAFYALLATGPVVLIYTYVHYRQLRAIPSAKGGSKLLSSMTGGDLLNGYNGKTKSGLPFSYLISGLSLFSNKTTTGIYSVELPFSAAAHLVGIPVKSDQPTIDEAGIELAKVTLEGDYPSYFRLYGEADQQVEARYVLDPSAMAFTIDFCQKFCWEIQDDTLFFMSLGHLPSFEVVDQFIREIQPSIALPEKRAKNPATMPYVETHLRTMYCPICEAQLVEGDQWLECPNAHGCLITGNQLHTTHKMRRQGETIRVPKNMIKQHHEALKCPYCLNPMRADNFPYTTIVIDVCTKCMYRWFDADELKDALRIR